jgi:hypothetical protein
MPTTATTTRKPAAKKKTTTTRKPSTQKKTPLKPAAVVEVDEPIRGRGIPLDDEPLLRAPVTLDVTNSTPHGEIHTAARRVAGDESIKAPELVYADEDEVCISVGYGSAIDLSQRAMLGASQMGPDKKVARMSTVWLEPNRIARNVKYWEARDIQHQYKDGVVRIHPNDATETEIGRRCGIRPGDPHKIAAQVLALIDSDEDAFLTQFTPAQLRTLAIKIGNKAALAKAS